MNTHCLTKEEHDYLCNVLGSIHMLNWKLLEALIITNPKKFEAVSKAVLASDALNGMTILHAVIRFNPPPSIVNLIAPLTPFAASSVDVIGQSLMHIAAGIRANPQSIKILIDACPDACAFQDADGRTPLHFACDVNCELFAGDEGVVREPPSLQVVQYLATKVPGSVTLEDDQDMSVLEYAILSGDDMCIVKFHMYVTRMESKNTSSTNALQDMGVFAA